VSTAFTVRAVWSVVDDGSIGSAPRVYPTKREAMADARQTQDAGLRVLVTRHGITRFDRAATSEPIKAGA
jgi:hypothetical protein